MRYRSTSTKETQEIAASLAGTLLASKAASHAAILCLQGTLGSGKTTFTQGFLRALGVRAHATSPTFALMHRYDVRKKPYKNVYHIDGYRLNELSDFMPLGLDAIFADPTAIVLIEWPERAGSLIPKHARTIRFTHGKKLDERAITVPKL